MTIIIIIKKKNMCLYNFTCSRQSFSINLTLFIDSSTGHLSLTCRYLHREYLINIKWSLCLYVIRVIIATKCLETCYYWCSGRASGVKQASGRNCMFLEIFIYLLYILFIFLQLPIYLLLRFWYMTVRNNMKTCC